MRAANGVSKEWSLLKRYLANYVASSLAREERRLTWEPGLVKQNYKKNSSTMHSTARSVFKRSDRSDHARCLA